MNFYTNRTSLRVVLSCGVYLFFSSLTPRMLSMQMDSINAKSFLSHIVVIIQKCPIAVLALEQFHETIV
jgi:hypothetical protein